MNLKELSMQGVSFDQSNFSCEILGG